MPRLTNEEFMAIAMGLSGGGAPRGRTRENPTVRAPILEAAAQYAALADTFERARKLRTR
jgi:hypothetical protein